jgi:predicted Zn-dependent peptidase
MKRITLIAACILFNLAFLQAQIDRTQPPKAAKAAKIQLGDSKTFKLDNGLTVILVENHELPVVSFTLQIALEPILEGPMAGTASLAGGLLRAGTTKRTKAELDKEIDFIGADISTGQSGIQGSSLKKHQDKVLELMTDILYNPIFPQEEFDKLKKQTLSALAMSGTDPNSIASTVASVLRFGKNHPYGEPSTEETIGNVTLDGVKNYYKTYFSPSIGYLVMIGDLKLEEAKVLANKYFASWKTQPVKFAKYDAPAAFKGNRVAFVDKSGAVQSVITITNIFRLKPGDPDVLPASMMNNILGGGVFSGRLMMNLREKRSFTYGANSSISSDKLLGQFNAGAQVRNSVTDSAVTEFLYEMRRMRDEPVTAEDLMLTKNVMAGEFGRALESPATLATFAMNTVRYNLPADFYATYLERLEKVTAGDVQAMAKKYLQPDNCIILVVGNKSEVADKLKGFAATGKVELYDRYGNTVVDQPLALPEGMTATNVIDLYLQAIGGKQNVQAIKSVSSKATGKVEAMGQKMELAMETAQSAGSLYQIIKMGEMVINKQVYNGTEGWVEGMGGASQELKGADLEKMRDGAILFPELRYFGTGFQTTLEGIEAVDGRNAYRIKIIYPSGTIETEFFEISTGLKIRKTSVSEVQKQTIESITDYADYRDVSGTKFPYSIKQSGAGQVIEILFDKIEINGDLKPELFKK